MRTAWVFGGHGAQYVGMGRAVLRDTASGRAWLADAERASGLPLGTLAAQGPARRLADPRVLEPLLAAVSGAHADRLAAEGGPPDAVAAYSAGHVAALYAAGAIDRATCLAIACVRGAALAAAAQRHPGGMMAVHGLPEDRLALIAEDDAQPAFVAARNAPMHMVYAGSHESLARAAARAAAAGAQTAALDVAGPWHTPLLGEAAEAIAEAIADFTFAPAAIPVWTSVTGRAERHPGPLRTALAASVACPVEWHATLGAMREAGIAHCLEVSPGRALWALLGQSAPGEATPGAATPGGSIGRGYVECARGPARRRADRPRRMAEQQMSGSEPA